MLIDYFEPNKIGNDYVFGDIHGMYDYFKYCLDKLNFDTGCVFKQRLTCYNINSDETTSFEYEDWLNNV